MDINQKYPDPEKHDSKGQSPDVDVAEIRSLHGGFRGCINWIASLGVEVRDSSPVPVEERIQTRTINLFTLWFTMSINLLPIVTGMAGTIIYGLSLRDASLVILFFSTLSSIAPAYLAIFGPKTGMRQMVLARYSFGYYVVSIPVLLNLATLTGFCIIDATIGGQTLTAVTDGRLAPAIGIVIVSILALLVSFCGIRVLHYYERFAWFPALVAIVVATGCGGRHLAEQSPTEPATASTVISFGALVAGFLIPWAALASDFATYLVPSTSSVFVFGYTYAGLCVPTVLLMVLGAAIGGATASVPSWSAGYESTSAGGVLAAMLAPAGGFGKFLVVILSLSILGNIAATMYSITLNFQALLPRLLHMPRYVFSVLITVIVIPVSIRAAASFFDSLENFIGVIGYWSAAFVSVIVIEHLVFRRGDFAAYDAASWDVPSKLPSGVAALSASAFSFALVVPCMSQLWYTGPIATTTGDIGFEMALIMTAILYAPFRFLEARIQGHL